MEAPYKVNQGDQYTVITSSETAQKISKQKKFP
jgi:hypothetical protein